MMVGKIANVAGVRPRRWWRWGVLWVVLVGYFVIVRGPDDPYTSGHMLLLAKSYVHAHFQTPLLAPMEDPYGPVAGWSPYTGQLPIPPLLWAGVMRFTGVSWNAARSLACLFTAVTAVLTFLLARRVTRDVVAAFFALAAFCGNGLIILYAGFAWHDTLALPWVLLLILLFPSCVANGGGGRWGGYLALTVLGGGIGWWCYMAPVACAAALAISDRERLRACWRRVCVLVGVMAFVGLGFVLMYRHLEGVYHPNGWLDSPQGSTIVGKILTRTGWNNPSLAVHHVFRWAVNVVSSVGSFAVGAALVVAVSQIAFKVSEKAVGQPERWGMFYLHALWVYAVLWTCAMAQMVGHTFEAIHGVPFFAVLFAVVIQKTAGRMAVRGVRYGMVVALCALVALPGVMVAIRNSRQGKGPQQGSGKFIQPEVYAALQADMQELTTPETVAVMGFDERGCWWSTQRPAISLSRLSQVIDLPHVLVLPLGENAKWIDKYRSGWEGRYQLVRERRFGKGMMAYDYGIYRLRPTPNTSN